MIVTKALRGSDPEALTLLEGALCDGATLAEVAEAFGLAGPSTLWRIAYATPAVRAIIEKHGRRKGRRCSSTIIK